MRNIYELAIFSQGACNLGALVRSWAEVMNTLQQEARDNHLGSEWINKHPINVLFAEQIYHLTGQGSMYSHSYAECVAKSAAGLPTPGRAVS